MCSFIILIQPEEEEADEHVWLSLRSARKLVSVIAEAIKDATYKTILFGDRFPFRYLVDDYPSDLTSLRDNPIQQNHKRIHLQNDGNLSPYEQKKVYHHEMGHIERGEIWDMKFSEYGEIRE